MWVVLAALAWPAAGGEVEALRGAVDDLAAAFGGRYPRAAEFRQRLEKAAAGLAVPEERASAPAALVALRREALIANPLVSGQPLLFVTRRQYRPDHHNTATFFPAARHEFNDGAFSPGGALKVLDLAGTGPARVLLEMPRGVIRDPEVDFDGRRVVFSMRQSPEDSYHIYEMNLDGTGLHQLTRASDVDDLDPLYLPDGGIVFSSTREPKYCMCNRHIMANLFRMDGDGANINQIGKSTLFEGHSSLLPDGRILYDRWEYVDRNFGDAQGLWAVNPDGTGHAVYWGNNTASPGGVIDGRAIPGTELVMCVFGSCHDRPWGALAIVDRRLGLDGRAPVVRTWPAEAADWVRQSGWEIFDTFTKTKLKFEDPYPLSDKYFLCSRMTGKGDEMGVFLVDVFGNEVLLHAEAPGCFDPMPAGPRTRPPVIPSRRDFEGRPGVFYVQDVYQGAHMAGVARGAVKQLRVVETPEKRFWTHAVWGGQGIEGPAMNWHDFSSKRILGTVPVEADGSARFEVPADRFVYFQLLDADGMMVQSMRSGVIVHSGEQAACAGCHDERRAAPPGKPKRALALERPPSRLDGWRGSAREFNYLTEVQPVFDRHCLGCHDFGKSAVKTVNLAGDRDLVFNVSYNELWRRKLVQVPGAGPAEIQKAYSWGSHASKLAKTMQARVKSGSLTQEEFERVAAWIDLNAPYYPSYASAHPDNLAGRSPLDNGQLERLEKLTGVPLRQQASHGGNRGPQVCFERPALSPCLTIFTNRSGTNYLAALAIIDAGRTALERSPEADKPGFEPCAMDQWREAKYVERQQAEKERREAIRSGGKVYDAPSVALTSKPALSPKPSGPSAPK